MGVLITRTVLFWVHVTAPDLWKLPTPNYDTWDYIWTLWEGCKQHDTSSHGVLADTRISLILAPRMQRPGVSIKFLDFEQGRAMCLKLGTSTKVG